MGNEYLELFWKREKVGGEREEDETQTNERAGREEERKGIGGSQFYYFTGLAAPPFLHKL